MNILGAPKYTVNRYYVLVYLCAKIVKPKVKVLICLIHPSPY
jgi:hypothetical protein